MYRLEEDGKMYLGSQEIDPETYLPKQLQAEVDKASAYLKKDKPKRKKRFNKLSYKKESLIGSSSTSDPNNNSN